MWAEHWPDEVPAVYASMRAVTSVMRVHQIVLARLDAMLRPHGITFSRYEALVLLVHSREGRLPLSRIGERLQVHATSVTNIVDGLTKAGLARREPNPADGRSALAVITDQGRAVAARATVELNEAHFGLPGMLDDDLEDLFRILRRIRISAADFDAADAMATPVRPADPQGAG